MPRLHNNIALPLAVASCSYFLASSVRSLRMPSPVPTLMETLHLSAKSTTHLAPVISGSFAAAYSFLSNGTIEQSTTLRWLHVAGSILPCTFSRKPWLAQTTSLHATHPHCVKSSSSISFFVCPILSVPVPDVSYHLPHLGRCFCS